MGYTPYKMLGHELPGPKQRAPGKMSMEKTHINDKMVDGVSKKSGVLYKEGSGVGSSPAKGWLSNIVKKVKGGAKKALDPLGLAGKAKEALGVGGDSGGNTAELEARVSALEESSSGGGNAVLATAGEGPGTAMNKVISAGKKAQLRSGNTGLGGAGLSGTGLGGSSTPFEGWMGV